MIFPSHLHIFHQLVGHIRGHRIMQMDCACTLLPSFSYFGFRFQILRPHLANRLPVWERGWVPHIRAVRHSQ